jgi:hypothetical protein
MLTADISYRYVTFRFFDNLNDFSFVYSFRR